MGQCSTLPEARNASSASTMRHNDSSNQGGNGINSSRQRLKEDGRTESTLDFNKLTQLSNENTTKPFDQRKLNLNVPANGDELSKFKNSYQNQMDQQRDPEQGYGDSPMSDAMNLDQRDISQPVFLPPPPDCAKRTRCYKLNLDSEILVSTKTPHICLGPFSEPPPPLTVSSSEDSIDCSDVTTTIAIQTAQIFRGITVAKDGTILSQNARATRSNRGKANKKGEKSRQAAKIDKAKDLVEESIATGKDPESGEPANMVSLVIVGAYDDMKYLVRDGSKKLREADGLPDETLFAANRSRNGSQSVMLSTPSKNRIPPSSRARGGSSIPQSAPPKLKSNPRDSRSKIRRADDKPRRNGFPEACSDMNMMDASYQGVNGEGDWKDALGLSRGFHSIWNCGGAVQEAGTVSPTQMCSPNNTNKPHEAQFRHHPSQQHPAYEGRDATMGYMREGEMAARAN